MRDNAGRALANASSFPLKVQTGSAPPIAKFAAAPFGIVEQQRRRDAAGDAAPRAGRPARAGRGASAPRAARARPRAGSGQVRVKRLQSDADILAWYARLQKYHETQLTAQELGLPEREWYTFEEENDAQGPHRQAARRARRRHARGLAARPRRGRDPARPAAARRRRPAPVRGRRHPARRAGLPRRRDRVAPPRPVAARQARADVRAHRRSRHQPRRPLQARPREQRRLGDDARPRQAGRRRRRSSSTTATASRSGTAGATPRASPSSPRALAPNPRACVADSGYFVSARSADAQGRRDRRRLRLQQLAEGHRAVALQRADRPRRRARPARLDGLRPHPAFAPARRCR